MKYLPVLIFLLACAGCKEKQQNARESQETKTPVFEMVAVPNLLTNPQDRADYAITHYWDKFNFTDTTYIHYPEVTEQAFSNYLYLMSQTDLKVNGASIQAMLKKAEAEKKVYTYFIDLYEKYLYDPNAPMRNEELYIYVLEAMLQSPLLDDANKIRPAHLLEIAQKNRVGQKAIDFEYTLANGKTGRLYGVKAEYLLLYFYNPDCETCRETTAEIANSPVLNNMIQTDRLKVLSVYPDEDQQQWKNHLPEMPAAWINGYDREIKLKNEELYDLKAIPTLYLLDKEKRVLLKDAPFRQIEAWLYNSSQI